MHGLGSFVKNHLTINVRIYFWALLDFQWSSTYLYAAAAAAAAKLLQLCPSLCNPIDRSPPGSPVPGILQARTLEWVAISFSNAWKWKVKVKPLSRVRLLATPWTAAYQAPPSLGFSRQEYWSGLPLPSPYLYASTVFCSFVVHSVIRKCENSNSALVFKLVLAIWSLLIFWQMIYYCFLK